MKKCILSILTVLVLCLTLLPMAVVASDDNDVIVLTSANIVTEGEYKGLLVLTPGKSYKLGENISTTVVIRGDGSDATVLDLDGYMLSTSNENVIGVAKGKSLIVKDSNSNNKKYYFSPDSDKHWLLVNGKSQKGVSGGVIYGAGTKRGVYVDQGASFTLEGGNIVGCSSSGVAIAYGAPDTVGSFTMKGGSICGCGGGGVYVGKYGQFTMSNGNIIECVTSYNEGGGVYVHDNGQFTMSGGSITNCVAKDSEGYGGGVYARSNATFTMSGGEISDCHAGKGGCALSGYSNTKIILTGGTIGACTYPNCESVSGVDVSDKGSIVYAHGGEVKASVLVNVFTYDESYFGRIQSDPTLQGYVEGKTTAFTGKVTNKGTISSGIYYGGLENAGGTISGKEITFMNDGKEYAAEVVGEGQKSIAPIDPTTAVKYLSFDGWYTPQLGGTKFEFGTTITANTTLYAKWKKVEELSYTNTIQLGGTCPPTANQEFELEFFYNRGEEPTDVDPLTGSSTTTLNNSTIFNGGTATLTGNMIIHVQEEQLAADAGAFPCFVRQKAVTALGWTSVSEVWALVYETPEGGTTPELKIYPAELVDGKYQQKVGEQAVAQMTFTNTYTGYSVYWNPNRGGNYATSDDSYLCEHETFGAVGTPITAPTDAPIRNDYTFDGWYTAAEGGTKLTDDAKIGNSDVTYYGHWSPIAYTVTWDYNRGQGDDDHTTTSGAVNTTITAPTDPTRNGYVFDGWYDAAVDGTKVTSFGTYSDSLDGTTYYAHWKQLYTVTWDVNGGDTDYTPNGATTSGVAGTTITVPTNAPTRNGYTFDGWYTMAEGGTKLGENDTISQGGVTYYAHWTPNPIYTITFDPGEGTVGTATATTDANGKLSSLPTPTQKNHNFLGWFTESGEMITTDTIFTEHTTVYAQWQLKSSALLPTWQEWELIDKIVAANKKKDEPVETEPIETEPVEEVEPAWENPFADVAETDAFYEAIKFAYENGYMNGMSSDTFAPNEGLTRGMLVTVLYRAAGSPVMDEANPFTDVAEDAWYYNAVVWAKSIGLINGITETEFAPENELTREQLVTIFYRYAEFLGYDLSVGEDTNILSYEDFADIAEYAIPALQWACGAGLIENIDGNILPKDSATRALVAMVLYGFYA